MILRAGAERRRKPVLSIARDYYTIYRIIVKTKIVSIVFWSSRAGGFLIPMIDAKNSLIIRFDYAPIKSPNKTHNYGINEILWVYYGCINGYFEWTYFLN